ncbi:glycosyltransferase [Crenalkalicoccus roseus]|uniref:glycosyltransferase n=1 Tax=Crenalkalicoccus roseus TaxID=1485588 RepID=UPI0010821D49|nr:glycosyltransferase [Crenalkalicoccus roseus]
MSAGPQLVVFAPLPPSRSGVAAYTAELLPPLARALRLVVVVAREEEAAPRDGAEVITEREYRRRPGLRALPHLHQLGNSLDHEHVYRAALRRPGILVLHEVVLHHLVEALTLARGAPHAYEAVLAYNHGPAGRRLARLRQCGLFSPWQRFLMPLHRQVLDPAAGVIVHSRFAAARLDAPPGLPVRVVPHHRSPQVEAYEGVTRQEARARLGLPLEGPLLLALGHVTPAKQVTVALEALALLRAGGVEARCVVAGPAGPEAGLEATVARLGLGAQVRLAGWVSEEAFFLHLRAADLLLALRFPSGGESSGSLARALAMGTPAIAYDFGPAAEYPDTAVAKLPFGSDPAPALARALAALLADPAALAARGAAARAHMREACGLEASAAAYLRALRDWTGLEVPEAGTG